MMVMDARNRDGNAIFSEFSAACYCGAGCASGARQRSLRDAGRLSRCQKVPEKCSFARLLPFNMGISDAKIPDFAAISGIIGLARGLAGGRPSRR